VHVLNGELPAKNQGAFVEYVPGSRHQYSNIGFNVVQLLLEDVLGKTYQEIVQETLFSPLSMVSSTFEFPLSPDVKRRAIKPHDQSGTPHENGLHPTALAHGGLVTTPTDLALFAAELLRAYHGKSDRILSQTMAARMFDAACAIDPNQWFGLTGEGLGVFLVGEGENKYFLFAGFNSPGATCFLVGSPHSGSGAAIMTNSASGLQLSMEVLASIVNEYNWPRLP
jgi:CubicO group peptidase (beta-lactamase class C family)